MAELLSGRLIRFRHQRVLQEVERRWVDIRIRATGARHRPGYVAAVCVGRNPGKVEIGPVHWKVDDDLPDRTL
jgi:hypothetical protein